MRSDLTKRREYDRAHYARRKDLYAARNRRAATRRREWLDSIKVGPCLDCKLSFPPYVMQFDHRPGLKKDGNISTMILRRKLSRAAILREVAKCDLVCANCHAIRTHNRRAEPRRPSALVER